MTRLICSSSGFSLSKGWLPATGARLEAVIRKGAGKKLPVVFDFDNTVLCRDIGKITFAVLVRDGKITKASLREIATPEKVRVHAKSVSLLDNGILQHYDNLLKATSPNQGTASSDIGYAWAAQALHGLTLQQVIDATSSAYQEGKASADIHSTQVTQIAIANENTSVEIPFFYPQMVELMAELLRQEYDIWVISASNVWSVRWLVLEVLNKELGKRGISQGISPDHVIGISVVLQDSDSRLFQDRGLLHTEPLYANLASPSLLQNYRLTSMLVHPLSTFEGKQTYILQRIPQTPYLVAGDSQNDYAMLGMATHKLFIARLDQPELQENTMAYIRKTSPQFPWMLQPVLTGEHAGFVENPKHLPATILQQPKIKASLSTLGQLDKQLKVSSL